MAAATGLLSSCARPADIRPSAASFSRCCSAAPSRSITGRNARITFRKATGVSNSRRRKSGGSIRPTRARSAARIVTIDGFSLSARIAPAHVGATC